MEIYLFFGYWQVVVCLFAFVALMAIWNNFSKNQLNNTQDQGLWWLSFSILVWAFSGGLEIYYGIYFESIQSNYKQQLLLNSGRSLLSILNSTFILLSLPFFKYVPTVGPLKRIMEPASWKIWILTLAGFVLVLTCCLTTILYQLPSSSVSTNQFLTSATNMIDVFYAFLTLLILGITLWNSFDQRNFRALAILTVICIGFTVIAQVMKMGGYDFWGIFFSCTFKTMLIMIFFALALTWVAEEIEAEFIPEPASMLLSFAPLQNGRKQKIIFTLPNQFHSEEIWMNQAPYQLLQKFAERRLNESPQEGWLKIKPKGTNLKHDIASYNQIKSIFKDLLNHKYGKGNWSEQELNFLRKALIERHQQKDGLYRLRLPAPSIQVLPMTN